MSGYPVTCPECDGAKGWQDMDSRWVECSKCQGHGYVDEDELEEETLDDDE